MEDLKAEKKKLDKAVDANNAEGMLKSLQTLSKAKITFEQIRDSKVGKTVGKLRKHSDKEIQELSSRLVSEWKKIVEAPKESDDKKRKTDSPSTPIKKQKKEEEEPKRRPPRSTGDGDVRAKTRELLQSALGAKKEQGILPRN